LAFFVLKYKARSATKQAKLAKQKSKNKESLISKPKQSLKSKTKQSMRNHQAPHKYDFSMKAHGQGHRKIPNA